LIKVRLNSFVSPQVKTALLFSVQQKNQRCIMKDRVYKFIVSIILMSVTLICFAHNKSDNSNQAGSLQIKVSLKSSHQVPSNKLDSSAVAKIKLNLKTGELRGRIKLNGLDATVAHIHQGYAGENGPVIASFQAATNHHGNEKADLVLMSTQLNPSQIELLKDGAYYINVHSQAYPNGAVRGQILPKDVTVKVFTLSGSQHSPFVFSDANGTGYVTVNDEDNTLTISVLTQTISDANAVQLHTAAFGENGDAVISLNQDSANPNHWLVDQLPIDQHLVKLVQRSQTYINVQSSVHMNGELRGQVISDMHQMFNFSLSSLQTLPPYKSEVSASAAMLVDQSSGRFKLVINAENMETTDVTEAHVHLGAIASDGDAIINVEQSDYSQFSLQHKFSKEQLTQLNNGELYLDIHSVDRPNGALRGQMLVSPTPTRILYDPKSLIESNVHLGVIYGGINYGSVIIETVFDGNIATITESTDVAALGVLEKLWSSIDRTTGQPMTFDGEGVSGGRPDLLIDLEYSLTHVTGTDDQQTEPYNIAIPANTLDFLSVFYTMHALPLAENLVTDYKVFYTAGMEMTDRVLTVSGIEQVTVDAGTFEVYRVELSGDAYVNQTLHITTAIPRKLIKMEFSSFVGLTFELQAD